MDDLARRVKTLEAVLSSVIDFNFSFDRQGRFTFMNKAGAAVTSTPLPVVSANALHMQPLFQNLIGNALKFRGQRAPQIQVSYR